MDFDLFELDEDDTIFSSTSIEATQIKNDNTDDDIIVEFQCQGEDSLNSQFSSQSFIKNYLLHNIFTKNNKILEEVSFGTYCLQKHQFKGNTMRNFLFADAR